jgi:hypothetical protein
VPKASNREVDVLIEQIRRPAGSSAPCRETVALSVAGQTLAGASGRWTAISPSSFAAAHGRNCRFGFAASVDVSAAA